MWWFEIFSINFFYDRFKIYTMDMMIFYLFLSLNIFYLLLLSIRQMKRIVFVFSPSFGFGVHMKEREHLKWCLRVRTSIENIYISIKYIYSLFCSVDFRFCLLHCPVLSLSESTLGIFPQKIQMEYCNFAAYLFSTINAVWNGL